MSYHTTYNLIEGDEVRNWMTYSELWAAAKVLRAGLDYLVQEGTVHQVAGEKLGLFLSQHGMEQQVDPNDVYYDAGPILASAASSRLGGGYAPIRSKVSGQVVPLLATEAHCSKCEVLVPYGDLNHRGRCLRCAR